MSTPAQIQTQDTRHGLTVGRFTVLPVENQSEYEALLDALIAEHQPSTPTEAFLVREMAEAQWKLDRAAALEHEILALSTGAPVTGWGAVAEMFTKDCAKEEAILKLNRYEGSARRAWYKALNQLTALRKEARAAQRSAFEADSHLADAYLDAVLAPPQITRYYRDTTPSNTTTVENETKPMPADLAEELNALKRRDPVFDTELDRSQMSKRLRKWFERNAA